MVVIGGLDSITGALLGAIYLIGLPAIFGVEPRRSSSSRVASGLLAFVLYLPGGMAEVLHRFGDLVTLGISKFRDRSRGTDDPPHEGALVERRFRARPRTRTGEVAGVVPGVHREWRRRSARSRAVTATGPSMTGPRTPTCPREQR